MIVEVLPADVPDDCNTAVKHGQRYFVLVSQPRVYTEALAICKMMDGNLASVHSDAEKVFLDDYLSQNGYAYLTRHTLFV